MYVLGYNIFSNFESRRASGVMTMTNNPRKDVFNSNRRDEFILVGMHCQKEEQWVTLYRTKNGMWYKNDEMLSSSHYKVVQSLHTANFFPTLLMYKKKTRNQSNVSTYPNIPWDNSEYQYYILIGNDAYCGINTGVLTQLYILI